MKRSITKKITTIIICLLAGTILLCWLLNATLLETFYIRSKKESLQEAMEMISRTEQEGNLYTEKSAIELEKICAKGNITLMVMNSGTRVLYSIGTASETAGTQFVEIIMASKDSDTVLLERTEEYTIGRYKDSRLHTEYLILWGFLEDGNPVLMRTALESIRESVGLSNQFLLYVGACVIVLGAVISYFITRRITNPILQLAEISKRMTNLDFEAKFKSKGQNEIDVLGEHMNELSGTLEKTISELKSANNELLIDIEQKKQMDDMRKEFLSNVSHELKTPLALIQGYAEGLKECIHEDAQSREFYCEVIMDEAEKMNRMVKQLLSLNQLEFGNEMIAMERFELTELVRGVIQSTAILQEQEKVEVIFEEEGPVYVWADEFRTEEVLMNLMSNAIHYAEGEKQIRISIKVMEKVARICVFNTGFPIPEEELDKIWEKFYKVDKARSRAYGGTGIGLSIVKAIMDSFHQGCGVINHENGVEFWFELDCQSEIME